MVKSFKACQNSSRWRARQPVLLSWRRSSLVSGMSKASTPSCRSASTASQLKAEASFLSTVASLPSFCITHFLVIAPIPM
ncbi:unnamed protein product, partial [Symbiodinium necroappetens]